mmetsp:Transcript_28808/g.70159  ORF Transcript_28808/g.70159 Transcript_28808/m.70159 type:complete len:254 (-) Transcript_28808:479-1240(-)
MAVSCIVHLAPSGSTRGPRPSSRCARSFSCPWATACSSGRARRRRRACALSSMCSTSPPGSSRGPRRLPMRTRSRAPVSLTRSPKTRRSDASAPGSTAARCTSCSARCSRAEARCSPKCAPAPQAPAPRRASPERLRGGWATSPRSLQMAPLTLPAPPPHPHLFVGCSQISLQRSHFAIGGVILSGLDLRSGCNGCNFAPRGSILPNTCARTDSQSTCFNVPYMSVFTPSTAAPCSILPLPQSSQTPSCMPLR